MKKETNTVEQNLMISSGKFEKEKKYWLSKLNGQLTIGAFLYDGYGKMDDPLSESPEPKKIFHFPTDVYKEISRISNQSEHGIFVILAAGLSYLMSRYTGKDDIIIGIPILMQNQAVSYFNEILPLRNTILKETTFKDLLFQVKQMVTEAYENMNYPLERIVKQLDLAGGIKDIHRLFDALMVFKNIHGEKVDEYKAKEQKTRPLFVFNMTPESLACELYYPAPSGYDITVMNHFPDHFMNFFRVVNRNPMIKLADIDILSEEEKNKILRDFNNTDADYPIFRAIHRLFEEQVRRTPGHVALIGEILNAFGEGHLAYRELNEKSNQLAHRLKEKGVNTGCIIGVMIERSSDWMAAVLAVLKAGAAFLTLDPQYPKNRLEFVIKDANLQLILTTGKTADISPGFEDLNIDLNPGQAAVVSEHDKNTDMETYANIGEGPAYIIYTSGSTGRPKGVVGLHKGVLNRCNWMWRTYPFKVPEVCCQKTSMNFVDSIWEMFGPLLKGIPSVIIPDETVMDVPKFVQTLKIHRVTRIVMVPGLLYRFFDANSKYYKELPDLRLWVSSGEALRWDFPSLFRQCLPDSILLNLYGSSEVSADVTYYDTADANRESRQRVPIGQPIDNTRVYILDNYMYPASLGVSGEIFVGGTGLAAGYLNQPELTAERFLSIFYNRSYRSYRSYISQKIYRTGDLARWLPDGNIEYIARKDHQVKIRGFRIEPGEIETHLLALPGIKEAVVVDKTGKNREKYLCAYLVPQQEQTLELKEIRQQLAVKLPGYMIPLFFVSLDKIPLTATGKIHRNALPEPHEAGIMHVGQYIAPRNHIERKLVEIWAGLLETDKNTISIDADFFEIGGHSLRAVTLISIIHEEFNVELQLGDFFQTPRIKDLGKLIGESRKTLYIPITPLEKRDYYELSPAQKRMYIVQQMDKNSKAYNMTSTILFVGVIDRERFEKVFQQIICRHDSLRTSFEMIEGEPVQRVYDEVDFDLKYLEACQEDINKILESFELAFDLSKTPLTRAGLIKIGSEKYVLVVNIHHIVSDGTTLNIFMKEVGMLYNGEGLPALNIQYKDFAAWQNTLIKSGEMSKQERYWWEKYKKGISVLDLPTDYVRPAVQSFEGSLIHFSLDERQTGAVRNFALEKNVTLFMVLLAIFNVLLSKLSGQEEIVLGTPVAGRNRHKDLEQLIGLFLNTLLLENFPRSEKTFNRFLKEVKGNTIEAFENQDYQFEALVEKVAVDRNASRNPLFDVMFVLRNMEQPHVQLPGVKIKPYEYDNGSTKLDILLNGIESGNRLWFYIRFCTKLFKRATIERLIGYFKQAVDFILAYPDMTIAEIEIIPKGEKERLLFDFNDTSRKYPGSITIQELFESRPDKVPDQSAVFYDQQQITYAELNKRVNRLAHYLRDEYHVKSNHVIGVSVDRSLEMIIAIWGIIKAGAGYVAIDPNYPKDRVEHILKDSGVQWVITDRNQSNRQLLEGFNGEKIDIKGDWNRIESKSPENPIIINQPDDLLYVIYTSGSTGTPNGAMLSHDLLTNLIRWQNNHASIDSSLRVLQFTTINFCVSFQEIMCTLTSGGEVFLIGDIQRQDIDFLMTFLSKHGIEILYLPFSYLNFLFNESNRWHEGFQHTLKHIITAGEQLKIGRSMKLFLESNPGLLIHNHYGSSEMHVVTSFTLDYTLADAYPIPPAGKPIANTKIYILDDRLKPVPIGVWGELFVESQRELLGYINNEALTDKKMVRIPGLSGKHLYRSGDIGRWLEDGNIELGGRKDSQVKVRGFRVEPGEIESKILSCEGVKECVVAVREDRENQKDLYAYVVLESININQVKNEINKFLPQYMIPRLILLESLPLMPNGKVDRDKLPEPVKDFEKECSFTAPRSDWEKQVARIWQEVLGVEQVGIHTSFFDIGGNSLRSIKVNNRLKEVFQKDVPLVKMFEYTTISELVQYLTDAKEGIDRRQVHLNKMVNRAKTRIKKIAKHR
jgi:amino acid adenylation domain-containing protein